MGSFQAFGAAEEVTQETRKVSPVLRIFHEPGAKYYMTVQTLSDGRYFVVEHLSSGEVRKSILDEESWVRKSKARPQ